MSLSRYYHTLKYLKLSQILWRLWYRFDKHKPHCKAISLKLRPQNNIPRWLAKPSAYVNDGTLRFLNTAHDVSTTHCWNDIQYEKLWLYNLHYFDYLNTNDTQQRTQWHRAFIHRWIDENSFSRGNGWEPYPLSLRIVNWIKWALSGNSLSVEMQRSLVLQIQYLRKKIEWHLLGNHLLANAKALVFAGLFFEGETAEQWLALGLKIYAQQLSEQILADGGHFELSPMYQSILLEDFLDVYQMMALYQTKLDAVWPSLISKMLRHLQILTHSDGALAFFNDAACGIAPALAALIAYVERLGLTPVTSELLPLTLLPDSGYARLQQGSAVLLADVAAVGPDYLPGHAHADTLSCEFSLGQQRLLVNSGTSTYANTALRAYQRGTAAHNALSLDAADSSEVWGAFRVARRARVLDVYTETGISHIALQASHNGYHRLPGKPIHTRRWYLTHDTLRVEDWVSGTGWHTVKIYWHFHPNLSLIQVDARQCLIQNAHHEVLSTLCSSVDFVVEPGYFYPEFNKTLANQRIVITVSQNLPAKIVTEFKWT